MKEDIKLSEHFYLWELTQSAVAMRQGIENTPGPDEVSQLKNVCSFILEPVRRNFKTAIRPSSGFRSPELNQWVGSNSSSQHIKGQAVDFEVPGLPNLLVAQWIRDNLDFDQIILEFYLEGNPHSGWIHCSYAASFNRQMSLIFDGRNYKEF